MMQFFLKFFKFLLLSSFSLFLIAVIITAVTFYTINPELPSIENKETYQLDTPLRIYSKDEKLIAEFGVLKREPIQFEQIPKDMINAVISSEDSRFYQHSGVDYRGLFRAVIELLRTGRKGQGGSTITMQVARNFFLSSEKTYIRKIKEIFLSFKLEQHFSKEKILELYLNKIYLGHRAYGIASAAKIYYGKDIHELNLDQYAMIAGLPKAPSKYNPITNKKRATLRRNYVLNRMLELEYINQAQFDESIKVRDNAKLHRPRIELEAPYVAEMARSWLKEKQLSGATPSLNTLNNEESDFEEDIYTSGYKIYTTLDSHLQQQAIASLRQSLLEYDRRHGFKGVIKNISLPSDLNKSTDNKINELPINQQQLLLEHLDNISTPGNLIAAIILNVVENDNENLAQAVILENNESSRVLKGKLISIDWQEIKWAARYISDTRKSYPPTKINDVLQLGDIIYLEKYTQTNSVSQQPEISYRLAQIPEIEGALISLKPYNGEIIALSGGFDFYSSKYNRATQARRQPGSNFKPFIYSAALAKGYSPASMINDAPVVFKDRLLEGAWRPSNYSGKFFGPTRMRKALYKSRNMVSIRILMDIGVNYALNYAEKFGFDANDLPHNLSLALGSATVAPIQIAQAYATLANGGYQVTPWFIDRVLNKDNEVIYQHQAKIACSPYYDASLCPENIDKRALQSVKSDNVYLMTSMLKDVIKQGTGRKALVLNRQDLAGKTGTTNEQVDAWFSGYNSEIVTTSWVGFDQPRSLGRYETGGKAALPMWIKYMREALKNIPEKTIPRPENIITVKIDKTTGQLADSNSQQILFEEFIKGTEPEVQKQSENSMRTEESTINEELF